jgi:ATP-dependent DNA helicase RecG
LDAARADLEEVALTPYPPYPRTREAGLAASVFEELATRFRVTIPIAVTGPPLLDETNQSILACLSDGQGWLTSEIAVEIELTPRATRTRLAKLVGRGLLREIGTGPQDPQRRYFKVEHS